MLASLAGPLAISRLRVRWTPSEDRDEPELQLRPSWCEVSQGPGRKKSWRIRLADSWHPATAGVYLERQLWVESGRTTRGSLRCAKKPPDWANDGYRPIVLIALREDDAS